jgi:predicted metal-dependent hydrolase
MHNENSTHTTIYRDIKYPRIELKTGTLTLILPKNYRKEKQLLQKHTKWINQKQQTIQKALKQAKTTKPNHTRTLNELKPLINKIVQQTQTELNTTVQRTFYRTMKTKWASLSKNKSLTINTLTRHLPQNLIEYIIYHELTHAKHGKKHNKTFWNQINNKYPNNQKLEQALLAHWFQIQQTQQHSGAKMKPSRATQLSKTL